MLYELGRAVIPPIVKGVWRPKVTGLDNIPTSGGVILASNHLSFADSVVIPVVVPRKVVFLAKADYFTQPGLRGSLMREWFEAFGALPVDRSDAQAALDSLEVALEVLQRGEAFGIYPEGTRSRDGRLYRGRTGVAHLALTAGVPIVPVGLQDTEKLQPVGAKFARLVRVSINFGPAIHVAGQYDGVPSGRARREVTDQVMAEIARLSGQELAGVYNELPPDS
ncbi:MAG: lysophospholipid acyltransferase family protein [Nocardioides sp.]